MVNNYQVIGKLIPLFGDFFTFLKVGAGVKRKKWYALIEKGGNQKPVTFSKTIREP